MTLFALEKNRVSHGVVVVRDGSEALDYLFALGKHEGRDLSVQPELVLLDLKLPKVDGIEVLRRLRQHPATQFLPVVVLTTSDEEDDRRRSYTMRANSFVRKPVDFDHFVDVIRQVQQYWLGVNEPPPFGSR